MIVRPMNKLIDCKTIDHSVTMSPYKVSVLSKGSDLSVVFGKRDLEKMIPLLEDRANEIFVSVYSNGFGAFWEDIHYFSRNTDVSEDHLASGALIDITLCIDQYTDLTFPVRIINTLRSVKRCTIRGFPDGEKGRELCEAIGDQSYNSLTLYIDNYPENMEVLAEYLRKMKTLRNFHYIQQNRPAVEIERTELLLAIAVLPLLEELYFETGVGSASMVLLKLIVEKGILRSLTFSPELAKFGHPSSVLKALRGSAIQKFHYISDSIDCSVNLEDVVQLIITCPKLKDLHIFLPDHFNGHIVQAMENNCVLTRLSPLNSNCVGIDRCKSLLERNRLLSEDWTPEKYNLLPRSRKSIVKKMVNLSASSPLFALIPREILQLMISFSF